MGLNKYSFFQSATLLQGYIFWLKPKTFFFINRNPFKMKLFLTFHNAHQIIRAIEGGIRIFLFPCHVIQILDISRHSNISIFLMESAKNPRLQSNHTNLAWLHRKKACSTDSSSHSQIGHIVDTKLVLGPQPFPHKNGLTKTYPTN